jgi:hypothetical protein
MSITTTSNIPSKMNTLLQTIVPTYVDLETERSEIEKTVTEVFCDCTSTRAAGDSQEIEHDLAGKAIPLTRFVSKSFKPIFKRLVPIGYEDEAGFHYGSQ